MRLTIIAALLVAAPIAPALASASSNEAAAAVPVVAAEICTTDPAIKDIVGSGAKNSLGFRCESVDDEFITVPQLYQRGYRVVQIWEQAAARSLRSSNTYTEWAILVERRQ